MDLIPPVSAAMTAYPYSIEIDAHLNSAKAMMTQLGIHHLPVREANQFVGVITETEIRRAADRGLDTSIGSDALVRDVCSLEVYIVEPGRPLDEVLMHMVESRADSVLVVEAGRLAGIFTVADACRSYAEFLRAYLAKEEARDIA